MLTIRPITLRAANDFVAKHHRHSKPTQGHKFSIAVHDDDELVGVAIIGRPVARHADDGLTAEILRVCTDGTDNACSKLYGAAIRTCRAMGYTKIITYTKADENGASLKAANMRQDGIVTARQWNTPSRPRQQREPIQRKRWVHHAI